MAEYIIRETGYPGTLKQEIVGELVRCRDCRHYRTNTTVGFPHCEILKMFIATDDWFCAYGERKTDEDLRKL